MSTSGESQPLLDVPMNFISKSAMFKGDPADTDKSVLDTLLKFLEIFGMATKLDKCLILLGTLFTFAHGLCFLAFAMILGQMTIPFVEQYVHGYGNVSQVHELTTPTNTNQTHLLTRLEFLTMMDDFAIYYVFIAVAIFVLSFLQTCLFELAAEDQCYQLRKRFTFEVLRQELPWFETAKCGDLVFTLSDSVEQVREGIGHKFSMLLQYVTICGVQVAYALGTNWKLTIIFLTISPLPAIFAKFLNFGKLLATKGGTVHDKYGTATTLATEVLTNIERVLAFGKEDFETKRYCLALNEAALSAVNQYKVQSIGIGVFLVLLFGSYAVAFQHACSLLQDHSANLVEICTVFFTITIAVFALGQVIPWITTIAAAHGSATSLGKILNLPNPAIDASRLDTCKNILKNITGELKFDNVTFSYPSNKEKLVLDKFTVEIKEGQTVGIIGFDKSGKSTIANLMMRFYDPNSGNIFVNNDVKLPELDVAWYRKRVAIVAPSPGGFHRGTLFENIQAGRKDITLEQIVEITKLLNIHEDITKFEKGYNYELNPSRPLPNFLLQRLAIVRALVGNPTWVVFDDCFTWNQDLSHVYENIRQFRKGLVTIYIGNKPAEVRHADIIHVLEGGKIVESGSDAELMALHGKYFRMNMGTRTIALAMVVPDNVVPDPDDALVARISDEAEKMQQKYPSFFKILRKTNHGSRDWFRWILAAVGCFLTALVIPSFAYFYTDIVKIFANVDAGFVSDIRFWTIILSGLAVAAGIGYCTRAYFVRKAGEYMTIELRQLSFQSILSRPLDWFTSEGNSPANLAIRLDEGIPSIKAALENGVSITLIGFMAIGIAEINIILLGREYSIFLISCVVIIMGLSALQIYRQRSHQRIGVALLAKANLIFGEAVEDIWTIQSTSQEMDIRQRYTNLIYGHLNDRRRSCLIFALIHATSEMVIYAILGGAFKFGSWQISEGALEPISFFRIFLVLGFCLISFGHTVSFVPDFTKSELAVGRIMDLIEGDGGEELELARADRQKPFVRSAVHGAIKFDEVTVNMPGDKTTGFLENCSFEIPAGKTVAITGSRLGKSNFLSLIMRFYSVSGGQVLIDEQNIEEYDLRDLRQSIGYIPRHLHLFEGTIFENIAYGICDEELGDPERKVLVHQAAQAVGLENTISKMAAQYQTKLTQEGQDCAWLTHLVKRQIAIARAIVRNPIILLLEEPTDELNSEDEMELIEIIRKVTVGRTCLIITTNLELVRMAHLVGMYENMKLWEFGTNEELGREHYSSYNYFVNQQQSSSQARQILLPPPPTSFS